MEHLPQAAQHFGVRKQFEMRGTKLAIVESEKSGNAVGWHFHENPHLTFILRGDVIEGTKKEVYHCTPGRLLFHGSGEPHYNQPLQGGVTCLHLDFTENALDDFGGKVRPQGIFHVRDSSIKFSCYKLFSEALICDDLSAASIHCLSLDVLDQLHAVDTDMHASRPQWVGRLEEMIRSDYSESRSLDEFSRELSVHPVHVSRSFSRYFDCTLGEYIRKVRVERALALMSRRNISLTEIAGACGFADQSHFTRSFKQIMGCTPSNYRKLLLGPR